MIDLTKLVLHSNYPAFKNNKQYTGTLTISGTHGAGVTTKVWNITLDKPVDLLDVSFTGRAYPNPPYTTRPSTAYFKRGFIGVMSNYPFSGGSYDTNWEISWALTTPTNLQIKATYLAQYVGTWSLTPTNFNYRIIDYSNT